MTKKENPEEEINIDFKKINTYFKKYGIILLILIPIFLSIFFRVYPSTLPITDGWAQDTIYNSIKSDMLTSISEQYPNLPDKNKDALVDEQFEEVLKTNKGQIDSQVNELSSYFRSRLQDENGQTYLLAIDPYFYLRHVNNYLEFGHAGTIYTNEIEDSSAQEIAYPNQDFSEKSSWDGQRMAPIGADTRMSFHSSFGVFMHKILSAFDPEQTTLATMFILPIILCSLATLPAFFIGKRLAGNVGGFVAALMLAINANLLSRTAGGFSDTDSYNVLFPLIIAWLFIESIIQKDTKKRIMFASLAGLATGLFSFAWIGWWYFFDFILGAIGIYIIYLIIKHLRKKEKLQHVLKNTDFIKYIKTAITYILSSAIFVSLIKGVNTFLNSFTSPFGFIQIKSVAVDSLWPTILTTVAELNAASFDQIMSAVGGSLYFWIAVFGIASTFLLKKKTKEVSIQMSILLAIWFLGTIYAGKNGMRFILLLIPAFTIAFGVCLGLLYEKIQSWAKIALRIDKKIAKGIVIIIILILLISPLRSADAIAKREVPSMNDAWYNALTKIKTDTAKDSIINSWWDFGHWFITIADRRVTFDGAGQDRHMAYWVGRSLLSSDERKTLGILRMVDCGNNNAFWALDEELNDTPKSIEILNDIVILDKTTAKTTLLNYVSEETTDTVLKYSHCNPPEDYFITSEDMIGKAGVWAHFGSWDFTRASIYQDASKIKTNEGLSSLMEKYNLDENTANQYYYEIQNTDADQWIAPWPNYVSNMYSCVNTENDTICTINVEGQTIQLLVNPITMDVKLNSNELIRPVSVVYATEQGIVEKEYGESLFPFSIILIPNGGTFNIMAMYPELASSTFTKLFFFGGHGQECFSLFDEQQQVTGGKIYVWKVDWACQQENKLYNFN